MYKETEINKLLLRVVEFIDDILKDMSDTPDDVITNEELFIDIPDSLVWVGDKTDSITYDPSTGILDLKDFLELWSADINNAYIKQADEYIKFISDRTALFNDIMLKCIAAEKTAELSPDEMDSILELRVKLLKKDLITGDIEKQYINFDTELSNLLISIKKEINDIKNKHLNIREEFDAIVKKIIGFNTSISNKFIKIINEINDMIVYNKNNIIQIDDKLAEIVKIVTVSSIMVSSSDKKREIALSNYSSTGVEYLTATTFIKIQSPRTDAELGKSMKETVKEVTIKKEYTKFFKDLIIYYSTKL